MTRILPLILILLSVSPERLAAQEPLQSIQATVESLLDVLYGAKRPSSVRAVEKQLRSTMEKRYSFEIVVQRALGRNRQKAKPAELKQIVSLTTDLMIRTYSKRFSGAKRPQVTYGKVQDLGRNRVEIKSNALLQGAQYQVIYRMANTEKGWQIYDLVIEGVSLVANYRKQFDSHFQGGGSTAKLIAQLESQIASTK